LLDGLLPEPEYCEQRGVTMPSFGGYMLYSLAVLIPTFVLVTLVFFR